MKIAVLSAVLLTVIASSPPVLAQTPADGHLIGLTVGGAVLSQQAESFNQSDPFFGFIAGYHGDAKEDRFGTGLNLRFDGHFTATPRSAEGTEKSSTAGATPKLADFVSSRKSFDTSFQFWHEFRSSRPFTIGPYVAATASAAMDRHELDEEAVTDGDSATSAAATSGPTVLTNVTSDSDLKRRFEGGVVLHLYKEDDGKLFLQSFVGYGNDEAMDGLYPGHNTKHRFIGRLRVFPEGLSRGTSGDPKKITPMFGVEINAGRGPDHLKFFTGFAVDLTAFNER